MNNEQRQAFADFGRMLYNKEKDMPDSTTNSEHTDFVSIPRHAVRTALRQAENSVDACVARIRDAEEQLADLSRKIGATQDMLDRLRNEKEYLTRHVQNILPMQDEEAM